MTSRSRCGRASSALRTFSRRRFVDAVSNGDSAFSSSTKSPSSDSSSSPIGFSSETGCWAMRRMYPTSARGASRGPAQDLAHLARGALELTRDLLRGRLPAELLNELALDVDDLVELLDHVDG